MRDERFSQLCRSLEADPAFLEQRPILAQLDGTVFAGNHRLLAARHLGWTTVPAIIADVPDDLAKQRAMIDNNNAADWEDDSLSDLLAELQAGATDLSLLGFEDGEIERLLDLAGGDGTGEAGEDPGPQLDRAAELQEKWGTVRGDLWLIGKHRLLCGDSTSAEDVARLMGGERAGLVFTDPPYGVQYDGGRNSVQRDEITGDESTAHYRRSLEATAVFCEPWAPWYIWFGGELGRPVYEAVDAAGYVVRALIIWNKIDAHYGNFMAQYMNKHEPCLYCVREAPPWHGPTNEVTVWDVKQPSKNEDHPTQKPVELAVRAIQNSSDRQAIVADWFLGSGTTMVAAEQTGRRCYGMEIEPKYVAVALERLAGIGLEPHRG